jgi:DNA invertase Pin-like site-specific DNA recombinase
VIARSIAVACPAARAGMLDAIKRGEVSTVYAYGTDRLARSVLAAATLLDAYERDHTLVSQPSNGGPPEKESNP